MRLATAVVLLAYAAAVAVAGARWLPRAAWPARAPRAGIAAWLAGAVSAAACAAAAGLILAVPCAHLLAVPCAHLLAGPGVARDCLSLLRAQYTSAAGAAAGVAGGLLASAVAGRVLWCYGAAAAAARRRRAAHDEVLAVLARPGRDADVAIIDSALAAVYCLPGRRRIVLTTGALARLDDGELDAVLAHERAHLSGRHHLVLRLAGALERAFPGVRFFSVAAQQIG